MHQPWFWFLVFLIMLQPELIVAYTMGVYKKNKINNCYVIYSYTISAIYTD